MNCVFDASVKKKSLLLHVSLKVSDKESEKGLEKRKCVINGTRLRFALPKMNSPSAREGMHKVTISFRFSLFFFSDWLQYMITCDL